jgi:23S rRNA (uracil1939-C5)-methyltransferase
MVGLVVTSVAKAAVFEPLTAVLTGKFEQIKSVILNENSSRTNVILGEKNVSLYGGGTIFDEMCGNKTAISLHSFYQINTVQAERAYAIAAEYAQLKRDETLLDLYCGAGTIGLSMARSVKKLIGVEIVPSAIEDAKKNAAENGIENAEFICADAGKAARILYERGESPDVIIADPARKGCSADTLSYMVKMNPSRIVMISCNPATAARDCAILSEMGYVSEKCKAVDFFPGTNHVETVCLMSRKDK